MITSPETSQKKYQDVLGEHTGLDENKKDFQKKVSVPEINYSNLRKETKYLLKDTFIRLVAFPTVL